MRGDDLSRCGRGNRAIVFGRLGGILLVAILTLPRPGAAGERELQITVGPGYSTLPNVGEGLDGVGGGGEVTYGFSAFWSLSLGGFFGHHFGDTLDDEEPLVATNVSSLWLGPRFNLDILVVVPFVSLGPELLFTQGELQEDQEELDFGLRWTLGFDYRPRRNWSAGFEVNYHSFLERPLVYPVFITTLFRLSYHHEFGAL